MSDIPAIVGVWRTAIINRSRSNMLSDAMCTAAIRCGCTTPTTGAR